MLKRIQAVLLLVCVLPLSALAQDAPLRLGLFPNLTARVLLEAYQPLADHLTRVLKRPVYLETAPDFPSFVSRTREGRYDLLLTAPHLAYLAQAETGYRPLLTYKKPVQGLLVVRKDSPYRSLAELKGKTIAMADPLAIVVMMMETELEKAGLQDGRDYKRIEAESHNNAVLLVVQGKAEAGVLGVLPYQRLPDETRRAVRVLATTRPVLGQVYLTRPGMQDAEVRALRAALEGFAATPAGQAFFAKGDLGGLEPVTPQELKRYQPFGEEAGRRLEKWRRP